MVVGSPQPFRTCTINMIADGFRVLQPGTRNRFRIALLIYSMTNAVIFGVGIVTVLNVPTLRANSHI